MENFTDIQLRNLHKEAMKLLIAKCRRLDKDSKDYHYLIRSIYNMAFDKIYYKRGFSQCRTTKLYTWVN